MVNTMKELESLKQKCLDCPIILLTWASWDTHSQNLLSMMQEMPAIYANVQVAYVDCDEEEAGGLVEGMGVDSVQTIIIMHPLGAAEPRDTQTIEGVRAEQLTEIVEKENKFYDGWYDLEKKKAFRDIEAHVATYPFFIFVKGSKEEPKCKFTRRLVEMLGKEEYDYRTFNILKDQRIRQWLKVYSNWPTFPQLFINQKFVGGIDVVTELIEGEEFDEMVPVSCKPLPPAEKFKQLLQQTKIVLILSGTVENPKDDASRDLVSKVNTLNCEYSVIDITAVPQYASFLGEEISAPYVFMDGKPACGLDGLDQLAEQDSFRAI